MHLTIQPLSPALADDYFDFFEQRAFTDDSPYRCYCQVFQMNKAQYEAALAGTEDPGRVARAEAARQIAQGMLRGYLAYADGLAIGWCNTNDRANYSKDGPHSAHLHWPAPGVYKAVACFEIAPEYRGQGIATVLLRRALADAGAEGFTAVDAFPAMRAERFVWDYQGPLHLYEKEGFVRIGQGDGYAMMRREMNHP